MKSAWVSSSIIALAASAAWPCLAAEANASTTAAAPPSADTTLTEVIVTGTRQSGLKAVDSPAPVQLVGADAFKRVGQPDLIQALAQTLPSFNAQGYGQDTAALTLTAALRGLNPNETLVLVDGKRRDGTANLQVDGGTAYQGSATTDLSFIPEAAIDHIEVLQDGAAAQYGSDAMAGVVNIILKTGDHGGSLSATGGQYFEGDGDTGAWSLNKGFNIGDKGFFNFTAEERYHDYSRQGGADYRFSTPSGALNPGLDPVDASGIPGAPGYPDVNNIYGDPRYTLYNIFYNAGYNLTQDIQLYSFASYGHRDASAYENYRPPSKVEGVDGDGQLVVPMPNGFSPIEALSENDYSVTGGVKGQTVGWNWDLSTTYGEDHDNINVDDTANADLFPVLQAASPTPIAAQRDFYAGSFDTTEWTNNLDVSRDFDVHLASPLNVAFGAESRRDTYEIGQGEPASYYGSGAQAFPGYGPVDSGSHSRTSYGTYLDLAAQPITGLHLDVAGRYEHYSDFGDAKVGKVTARYDFNPIIAVRGTISTGFRAPTLAEEYYSGTVVSPTFAMVQLPADSEAARVAGFSPLRPETSHNYSVGFVLHPADRLQITLDAYQIDIADRIVGSGFLLGEVLGHSGEIVVSQAVLNAIAAHGSQLDPDIYYAGITMFTNGVNSQTNGAELTVTYASDFGSFGHVDWSAGANYNNTIVTRQYPLPADVVNPYFGQTALLGAHPALSTETPKYKVVLGAFWSLSRWSVNLRETVYGPVSGYVSLNQTGTGAGADDLKIRATPITDLDIGYKITHALKLDIGANNLLNTRPPAVPNTSNGAGGVEPTDGNNVYGEPIQFSPFGINGGYYYGRLTYTF